MRVALGSIAVAGHESLAQRSWWKLVLSGLLAFVFGLAAISLPAEIMIRRILDVVFGVAEPFSGGMTAVAALLALVAVVAVDGLIHLFGAGVIDKRAARIRGVAGVAVALAAVFWPGITAFIAVELIGLWAILVGVLEVVFVWRSGQHVTHRGLLITSAIASIVMGIVMMKWVFVGAVFVSAVVGLAAAARGISLIVSGIHARVSVTAKENS